MLNVLDTFVDSKTKQSKQIEKYDKSLRQNLVDNRYELLQHLREYINRYLQENSMRSLASLAQQARVPDSTLRRVAKEDTMPSLGVVIAILSVTATTEEAKHFLNIYFPRSSAHFDAMFYHPKVTSERSKNKRCPSENAIDDEISLSIIQLCASCLDVYDQDIERRFGEYGLQRLEDLINIEIIYREKDGSLRQVSQVLEQNVDDCLSYIEMQIKLFHTRHLGTRAAMLASVSESISLEGLRRLKEQGVKYIKRVAKIVQDHPGELAVYVAALQNVYDSDLFTKQYNDALQKSAFTKQKSMK